MLVSRALSLATVMFVVGWCTAGQVEAQENLDAGKSPSQIFGGTCAACHKSPRGLLRTVPPGSLTGFLRQHYTTSSEMAGVLASYLISNGASNTRYGGGVQGRSAFGVRPAGAPAAPAPGYLGRPGGNTNQLARPALVPGAVRPAAEGQYPPARPTTAYGPDGRRLWARQRRGKPAPNTVQPANGPAKGEASGDESSKAENKTDGRQGSQGEAAKGEASQPEGGKPAQDASPVAPASSANSAPPTSAAGSSGSQSSPAAPEPSSPPVAATAQPPVAPAAPPEPPTSR